MKKKVLILGSSGFIGRNLVEQLSSKYILLTPTHKELDLLNRQNVSSYFQAHKIDVVINAIVVGGSRKEEREDNALKDNLLMFFNIVNNKQYFKKLIHLGSGAEYDKSRILVKIKEKDFGKRIPSDDYGLFKYICSKFIEQSDRIINLRIFGLFGKYEDYRYRFISNAIYSNLKKHPITINKNVFFDYVYIHDFVKIVEYFIENDTQHKFYNIGTGGKIDILSIAKYINQISDYKSQIIVKYRGLNNEYSCDTSLLKKEIKNFKFTDIKIAIKELYKHYKKIWKRN